MYGVKLIKKYLADQTESLIKIEPSMRSGRRLRRWISRKKLIVGDVFAALEIRTGRSHEFRNDDHHRNCPKALLLQVPKN